MDLDTAGRGMGGRVAARQGIENRGLSRLGQSDNSEFHLVLRYTSGGILWGARASGISNTLAEVAE